MRTFRWAIASAVGTAGVVFTWPAVMVFTRIPAVAIGVAAVVGAIVAAITLRLWPASSAGSGATSRGLVIVSSIATIGALLVFGRMSVFMADPSRVDLSLLPGSEWEYRHSCVTAYFVAADASSTSSDVYAASLYTARDDDPAKPRKPLMIGLFRVDVFEYPPPFLLLPRALRTLTPDFIPFRMVWFGLNGVFILLCMIAVASELTPAASARAVLLLPLVWFSLPMMSNIQKGNVQVAVVAASMLAMVLFERRRAFLGGTLLAFAIVSKLYPGMLLVYLLARREWRAAAWTAAMAAVFAVVTFADLGRGVYATFAHHMPGLLSGEAFPAFRNPAAMAINFSIPGLIFKLKLFGVAGMDFAAVKVVGWIYTLVVVAATWLLARKTPSRDEKPLVWLAVLTLATLRSPFLPQAYAAVPPLWLLTLIAARHVPTAKTLAWTLVGWAALGILWPLDWKLDPRWLALLNGVPQLATILLAGWVVKSARSAASGEAQPNGVTA
jgi:hypothetical protein